MSNRDGRKSVEQKIASVAMATDRGFSKLFEADFLGDWCQVIEKRLKAAKEQGKQIHVLEIGCGDGEALRELCKKYPEAQFYGVDIVKPKDTKIFHFIQCDISDSKQVGKCFKKPKKADANNLMEFDIIFSAAVFPYIANKHDAVRNTARLLSTHGNAYIATDAFYFGPQALQIFEGSSIASWHSSTPKSSYPKVIQIKGGGSPEEINGIMADFIRCDIPEPLLTAHYYSSGKPPRMTLLLPVGSTSMLPELYLPRYPYTDERQRDRKAHYAGYTVPAAASNLVCWEFFEFVEVATFNPLPTNMYGVGIPYGAGTPDARPFRKAASTMYLSTQQAALLATSEARISFLTDPNNWDAALRKPKWKPSEHCSRLIQSVPAVELLKPLPSSQSQSMASACKMCGVFAVAAAAAVIVAKVASSGNFSGPK